MQVIDAHQHFWLYNEVKDAWITPDMAVIQRDFLPAHLAQVYSEHGVTGCVAVQADQSEAETAFLLELAAENEFIRGVVGWVDIQNDNLAQQLDSYKAYPKLKGFRHILQAEPDDAFMLSPAFVKGVQLLSSYGYTYDILVKPNHLKHIPAFVQQVPQGRFVIDHLAKPYIKAGEIDAWQQYMEAIATFPNVYCKVSGFSTEADWDTWTLEQVKPYLDVVFNAFGSQRLMFGSDWPVCNVAGGFSKTFHTLQQYLITATEQQKQDFWGGNAARFYNL